MRTAVAAITKRASATSSARREHGRGDTCPEKALSSQCTLWMPIGDTSRRKAPRHQRTAWTVLNRDEALSAPLAIQSSETCGTASTKCAPAEMAPKLPMKSPTVLTDPSGTAPRRIRGARSRGADVVELRDGLIWDGRPGGRGRRQGKAASGRARCDGRSASRASCLKFLACVQDCSLTARLPSAGQALGGSRSRSRTVRQDVKLVKRWGSDCPISSANALRSTRLRALFSDSGCVFRSRSIVRVFEQVSSQLSFLFLQTFDLRSNVRQSINRMSIVFFHLLISYFLF